MYLVPHLLRRAGRGEGEGGRGEGESTPYDLENGRLYKLQLWHAIRNIYERYKTGRVNDLSLVRFPWQLIYVRGFSAKGPVKLIKRVKIAHSFLQSVSNQFHVIILSLPMLFYKWLSKNFLKPTSKNGEIDRFNLSLLTESF